LINIGFLYIGFLILGVYFVAMGWVEVLLMLEVCL
jgi:hypothetical protein